MNRLTEVKYEGRSPYALNLSVIALSFFLDSQDGMILCSQTPLHKLSTGIPGCQAITGSVIPNCSAVLIIPHLLIPSIYRIFLSHSHFISVILCVCYLHCDKCNRQWVSFVTVLL